MRELRIPEQQWGEEMHRNLHTALKRGDITRADYCRRAAEINACVAEMKALGTAKRAPTLHFALVDAALRPRCSDHRSWSLWLARAACQAESASALAAWRARR